MEGIFSVILIASFATSVFSIPEERLKRHYNHAGPGHDIGAIGSDEDDASILDSSPCKLLHTHSGSPELSYLPDGPPGHHRGVSTSVRAAAEASASSFS